MINRVLIRIKVVQLLYSYLLSQDEFKIATQTDHPSRDRKYGYGLYLDLLLLVLELSGMDTTQGRAESMLHGLTLDKHINRNQLAKALNSVDAIRELILLGKGNVGQFRDIVPDLYAAIPELPAYKTYAKIKKPVMKDDVTLWQSIITNLIEKNAALADLCRRDEGFTLAGFNMGIELLKKTLAEYGDNRTLLLEARNSLTYSLDKAYELYNRLLLLAPEITAAQNERLERAKEKFYPTDEDLHPDTRFVDNKFVKALSDNESFAKYVEDSKISWEGDPALIEALRSAITSSEDYRQYMQLKGESTFEQDADLWRNLFKNVILPSDELAETLESKSIYWNDDIHVMGTFVLKTIRKFAQSRDEGRDINMLPEYKDDEDRRFGPDLFMAAVNHYDEYKELIEKFVNTSRWDADRLAFMDIVIMVTAIAEIMAYPAIPVAVSLNEYIEIANAYSTPRSGQFINGILFSVINHLREEGRLIKS